jgi:exodeoxyribonuclease-3
MKIITWNVNGLRAILRKGGGSWLCSQDADFICLQEIKVKPDQLTQEDHLIFNGYQPFWNSAERPGYSGVATFARTPPEQITLGTGRSEFDREGRVICTRYSGIYLFNVYFPSGQRGLDRVAFKLDFYEHLLKICDQIHAAGENVIICGDFNTAHNEIDLKNARQNIHTSGFLPDERAWIDLYLKHNFLDIFRQKYPTRIQYTWWSYVGNARARNTGWRLDYFLVSERLLTRIQDIVIHDDVLGSDHCPVSLILR